MNPPSDLARQIHAVLSGARGLTLVQIAARMSLPLVRRQREGSDVGERHEREGTLTVAEVYPGLRWLLRWGFAESKARIGREAVYVAVRGKVLPPAPAKPPRVRVRKPDSYGKPPVGWDAAEDLQACMGGWKPDPNDYLAEQ